MSQWSWGHCLLALHSLMIFLERLLCVPGEHKPSPASHDWVGLPDLSLDVLTFPHLSFLSCHQALHHQEPRKRLIIQYDNIKTIKTTYISKTASLLSPLQLVKICHSTHRHLEPWTWQVALRRPLLRPKPFFIPGLCQWGPQNAA